jgi:hypothetical protein
MPYDPTPVGPDVDARGRREALTVQVEGGRGEPDRVFRLGRPRDGVVEVRETEGGLAPRDYVERADALRERFEHYHHERRRLSAELHLVRNWLDGKV